MAAIQALEALTRPVNVHMYTDSKYVLDGITKWLPGWQRNGWKSSSKQPVKNTDLWQRLVAAMASHQVKWTWVKGHSGDPGNERADDSPAWASRRPPGASPAREPAAHMGTARLSAGRTAWPAGGGDGSGSGRDGRG